jgi:riboflavin synthase
MGMFTGIIEQTGRVEELQPRQGGARLRLSPDKSQDWKAGESISVNGACLTLAGLEGAGLSFDLGEETLRRTTLGALKSGDLVNLERALKLGERLGGHFVAGHVDGLGSIRAIRRSGGAAEVDIDAPQDLLSLVASKGSVAVQGISLTPFAVSKGGFTVSLIPATLAATTRGFMQLGDAVNLEADLIARYVARLMEGR